MDGLAPKPYPGLKAGATYLAPLVGLSIRLAAQATIVPLNATRKTPVLLAFPGDPEIPNARCGEDGGAAGAKPNQKRRWQVTPRADTAGGRERGAQEKIERIGPRALRAPLQDQIHCFSLAVKRGGTIIRAHHALRCRRFRAGRAQCLPTPDTDGHGFGIVRGAFH
jgi:hypothetical protein